MPSHQLEVPVVGRQPHVEHLPDGDTTVTENQRPWRLLATMASEALDTTAKSRCWCIRSPSVTPPSRDRRLDELGFAQLECGMHGSPHRNRSSGGKV